MTEQRKSDRGLWLRTLLAALALGVAGYLLAHVVTNVLRLVVTPDYDKYIRPAVFDARWQQRRVELEQAVVGGWALTLPLVGAALAPLILPFLLNRRWLDRRMLSPAGLAKVLGAYVLCAAVLAGTLALTGLFSAVPSQPMGGLAPVGGGAVASVALTSLLAALYFALFSEAAWLGAPGSEKNTDFTWRNTGVAALVGFGVGAVAALIGLYVRSLLKLLFEGLFSFLGELAEATVLGFDRFGLGAGLALALLWASVGALSVALAPGRSTLRQGAISLALAAVPAVALVSLGSWFRGYCLEDGELRFESLKAAARLAPAPAARLMLLPGPEGPQAAIYPMEAQASGFVEDELVGASPKNLERVRAYLGSHQGRWTAHTLKAWSARRAISDRLLKPEAAMVAQLEQASTTGSIVAAQLLAVRLARAALTPTTRELTGTLLSEGHFASGSNGKAVLAKVAAHVGAAQRARRLWDEALEEGFVPEPELKRPTTPAFTDGHLTGQLTLGNRPLRTARIGLYWVPTGRARLVKVPPSVRLIAARQPDAQGRFSFTRLAPGSYHFGILLPAKLGPDPTKVAVQGKLGPFALSKASKRIDAGLLRVTPR